jgi:arylsulfatase
VSNTYDYAGSVDIADYRGFSGRIGTTLRESSPWWPTPQLPPEGSPNIVIILLDDLGFSDLGCFGAELQTPRIDTLAGRGVALTGYTTVPMCTPARAALLSGKNPHSVGAGWLSSNSPGYPGYQAGEISPVAPTLAEVLHLHGYGTMAVGKWHNTPTYQAAPTGDRRSWPTHRGFDRFFGFLTAETNYFKPSHLVEGDEFLDVDDYPDDFSTTRTWTDRAISYITDHLGSKPDRPFFLYLAENAPHVPLQVRRDERAAYRGRYADGWDVVRSRRFARQKELGIIDERFKIPPHTPAVPEWDSLSAEEQELCARYMELYAGVVESIDVNVGRLVDFLEAAGELGNTLFVITSDNGANAAGGPYGSPNRLEGRYGGHGDSNAIALSLLGDDRLGDVDTMPVYPTGWAEACNTPFRMFKRTTMNGGICVPFVAHWPAGIGSKRRIVTDWVHVTDVMPTVLEIAGAAYPSSFRGTETRQMDGRSFAPLLTGNTMAETRQRQYYELQGNRGLIEGHWKIVSLQPPDREMDLDNWMLFDLASDPSETRDLATQEPAKLAELVHSFDEEARANWVYPLDNRGPRRNLTIAPSLERLVSMPRVFRPGASVPVTTIAPLVADRDFVLRTTFSMSSTDEGVLFALGDALAGFSLYVLDGELNFALARWPGEALVVTTPALSGGESVWEMHHRALGSAAGRARLVLNGSRWCELDTTPTFTRVSGGLDLGRDRRSRVTERYADRGTFPFTGTVISMEVVPGAQAPGGIVNRLEIESQRD